MNINLKQAVSKKKSPAIGFGLNKRGAKKKAKSVFQGDSSSDEDNDGGQSENRSSRQNFNKELAAEQAALRARAEKAMSASDVYDYDAEYESFSSGHVLQKKAQESKAEKTNEKREARYVQNLLQKAKERNYEREIILERKIAREQAEEDANLDFRGKDKFVTKSYKRKLEEREEWLREEERKNKRDEKEDVTKKTGGSALMGFYGNLGQIGAGPGASAGTDGGKDADSVNAKNNSNGEDYRGNNNSESGMTHRRRFTHSNEEETNLEEVEIEQELSEQSKRIQRLQKIFAARDRYLQRKAEKEAGATVQ